MGRNANGAWGAAALCALSLSCGAAAVGAAAGDPSGPGGGGIPPPTTGRHVDGAHGNDGNPGTAAAPWKTLSQAARLAQPGEVVWIHQGTYREYVIVQVSGNDTAGVITFQAVPGDQVTLAGDPSFGSGVPLLHVKGQHHLRFAGFTVSGFTTAGTTYGIWIDTGAHHVTLDGLTLSHIDSGGAGAALPILVSSADASSPTHDVTVHGTTVSSCSVLPGQAISVLGNVYGFTLEDNVVQDVDGIAIDLLGNYGSTVPASPPAGWTYDPVLDRARSGVIRGNTVARAGSTGIYVDGAQDLVIERNTVRACPTGIQVAAEIHSGDGIGRVPSAATVTATGITVRDNVVTDIDNGSTDAFAFVAGAWTSAYGPVSNVTVTNNTFRSTRGTVRLNPQATGILFVNNIVAATTASSLLSDGVGVTSANRFDHNLYYCAGAPHFTVGTTYYASLGAMASDTGREAGSLYADPSFVNAAGGDLTLNAGSPALGRGDPGVVAAGETDRAGAPRLTSGQVDIGAYQR